MSEPGPFPIGETLGGGAYRVTEWIAGRGETRVYHAICPARPDERYLASYILAPRLEPENLTRKLAYRYAGVIDLAWIGHFDRAGDDSMRIGMQRDYAAMVERLPREGDPLRTLVAGRLGAAAAVDLGLAVGRIVAAPARQGIFLVGIRPEFIWGVSRGDAISVTGLSGRTAPFFAQGRTIFPGSPPVFEHSYFAPELHARRDTQEESLVFTLAVLIAEWATGAYPFRDARMSRNIDSLRKGRHAPLEVPIQLASVLIHGLQPDPADRPNLGRFLERLALLDPTQLA
jgi:hypothetical protein